jgi:hypothetical protein
MSHRLLSVCFPRQVMGPRGEHCGGNWGQWNFGGSDPAGDSDVPLTAGALAAVVRRREGRNADAVHIR